MKYLKVQYSNMNKVVTSWEVDPRADKWKWGHGFLSMRGFESGSVIYLEPKKERVKNQIERLVEWSLGSRNWIVCISESTTYVRRLFDYVLACYVFTTEDRAISVDVDDLIIAANDPEGEKRDIIEHANLLLINYCDPNNPQLGWRRGSIVNILHRRKHKGLATMFNLFVREIPKKMDSSKALELTRGIVDVFGGTAYELFTDKNSKRVVIREE